MKDAYNKGPWKVGERTDALLKGTVAIDGGNHSALALVVVQMEDADLPSVHLTGNARLIAAAPQLFQKLQELLPPIPSRDAMCHNGICEQCHCFHCQRIISAHNLIADLDLVERD